MRQAKFFGFSILVLACVCTFAISQDKTGDNQMGTDKSKAPAMDQAAAMKAMEAAATPGPQHKALEGMAGDFTYAMKFKMDPSQPEMTADGKYSGNMQLGGRYLFINTTGAMMGQQFEGRGCIGYDNVIGKYVMGWVDNMGTGLVRAEGTSNDDGKTITFTGDMIDPMTKKNMPFKQEFKVTGPDTFTMTWWSPSMTDGKMFESMNIQYTRVK